MDKETEKVLTGLSVVCTWCDFCNEQGLLLDDGMIRDTARYARAAYEWIRRETEGDGGK